MVTILSRTKQFIRDDDLMYKKGYIQLIVIPQHVYVFRFGKHRLNNRVVVRYSHTWTGRLKINETDVRSRHQHHPRISLTESDLVDYLSHHLEEGKKREQERPHISEVDNEND